MLPVSTTPNRSRLSVVIRCRLRRAVIRYANGRLDVASLALLAALPREARVPIRTLACDRDAVSPLPGVL